MCLIVLAYQHHPEYPFIFAGNRDEHYDRPTRPARFWDAYPSLFAGKDLESGGTWLGVTTQGRFATVTNFRDPSVTAKDGPSRGELVLDYLTHTGSTNQYMHEVLNNANRYNGFNLLTGNPLQQLYYLNNKKFQLSQLQRGIYGLSNNLLNNNWPKVRFARSQMADIVDQDSIQTDQLFELLYNEQKAASEELPDTGLTSEQEKAVSSIFVETEHYGTRSSTVLMVDREGTVYFDERYHQPGQKETDRSHVSFSIGKED